MTSIERINEYIQNHPNQNIWEHLQKNPKETEYYLGVDYEELQELFVKTISLEKRLLSISLKERFLFFNKKNRNKFKQFKTIQEEILFLIFKLLPDLNLDFQTLGILFNITESRAISIYESWKSKEDILVELFNNSFKYVNLSEELDEITLNISPKCRQQQMSETYEIQSETDSYYSRKKRSRERTKQAIAKKRLFPTSAAGRFSESNYYDIAADYNYHNYGIEDDTDTDINNLEFNTKVQPLPHDGLFIRRNNEFGTRLNVGIKDLIDQGILIDQINIRFDDFIALNSERVPSPEPSQSLAVSYGIAPIPLSHKRDERATHYLEIALRTSDIAPSDHPKNKAPSANYIFVIDTSGSMSGEKLDDVKVSIRELFQRMKEDDVIGIIVFNTRPKTLLKATRISQINIDEFSHIISGMSADGSTDINVALSFGIDEISRYGNNNTLNHIYLFSDGNPTSGETNWIKIRQNLDSKTRGNIRLSTFAFGSDANTKELDALAGLTGGKSTFVTHIDDIKNSLQEELNRREHLAALNVQIKLDIERDIEILYLYGHDLITEPARRAAVLQEVERVKEKAQEEFGVAPEADLITEEQGIKIFVPDLAVGETYWVVFELGIPEEKSQMPIGKATVQYVDTFARESHKPEFTLAFPGNLPSDLVVEHSLALWTSEVAFYVLDDLYKKDTNTAKKRIEKHVSLLRAAAASSDLRSSYIADDAVTLSKFASLFENLGKLQFISDRTPYEHQPVFYALNTFGRVRGGFRRADYYSV